jgi:ADP-heptose:LPS heptosyltransferase
MQNQVLTKLLNSPQRPVNRALILRPDNLGDVILFSGALRLIRRAWPNVRITICVKEFVSSYLELCPYVDSVIIWEEKRVFLDAPSFSDKAGKLGRIAGRLWRAINDWLPRVDPDLSYDAVLFPVRSPVREHHLFVRAVNAPVKVGISGDFANQSSSEDRAASKIYTTRYNLTPDRRWEHELKVTRDFLNFLGIDAELEDVRPEVWTNESDVKAARMLVPDSASMKLAVIPGANWAGRIYPPDRIVSAISEVTDLRLSCLIFGTSNEVSLCGDLSLKLSKCHNVQEIVDLSGKTNVRTLIECLRLCDLVFSAESAPLHIATALGKPSVGVIGGGHFGRFYPWGDPEMNRIVFQRMDCYFCNWNCPTSSVSCVREIPPSAVTREIEYLARRLKKRAIDM